MNDILNLFPYVHYLIMSPLLNFLENLLPKLGFVDAHLDGLVGVEHEQDGLF